LRDDFCQRTRHLVELAKEGDRAALEKLSQTYSERVQRIVRMRMGKELRSKLESMDIVQDTLICAIRGLDRFTYTDEGDFTRWLSHITENRLRDNLDKLHADKRDIRREKPLNSDKGDGQQSRVQPIEPLYTVTPSVEIEKKEQLDRLELAMDTLKAEYKEVIVLTKIEGMSYKEAADKLGKSPNALRMLLCRALAALSEVYEEQK
jgi:RNA polymerase sigma-70 factor, ECF subfamily